MSEKHTQILYMTSREVLAVYIESLCADGRIVTCVTPLSDFKPVAAGSAVVVADWLIVHYPKETPE